MNDHAMDQWIEQHEDEQLVQRWLAENPPPAEWQGTPMEWVYTEMPYRLLSTFPFLVRWL